MSLPDKSPTIVGPSHLPSAPCLPPHPLLIMAAHPLQLPEVLFSLGAYLDASQVLQCSKVCRVWYEAFAPLIWENLHVHANLLEDRQDLKSSRHARYISFRPPKPSPLSTNSSPEQPEPSPTEDEVGLSEFLQSRGTWLRSICYHGHGSTLQFSLGKDCTKLRSLSLQGPVPFLGNETLPLSNEHSATRALRIHGDGGGPYSRDYQERCKVLLRQNREHLQHLTLRDFERGAGTKLVPGYPAWNPLYTCGSGFHQLRSLSLVRCGLRGREVKTLWAIGPTLETLTLHSVSLNIGHWIHRRYLRDKAVTEDQQNGQESDEEDEQDIISKDRIFPRLQELHLYDIVNMGKISQLLEYIVKECPRLQTLVWRRNVLQTEFAHEVFADIIDEGFWPDLNSISILDQSLMRKPIMDRILTAYQQPAMMPPSTPTSAPSTPLPWNGSPKPKRQLVRKPLTRIDVMNVGMDQRTFDLFKHHFATLRHVNLLLIHACTRAWVLEVLTNCPTLEVLQSNMMGITDFVDLPPGSANSPTEDPTPGEAVNPKVSDEPEDKRPRLKRPWVCKNLQELHMRIEMEIHDASFFPFSIVDPSRPYTPEELQLADFFFQQLGTLTRLRVFNMTPCREITVVPRLQYRSALPLQLCAGLGHLRHLTSLERVHFFGRQDLNLWDLQWMLDHWPALKEIGGCPLSIRDDPEVVSIDKKRLMIYDLEFTRILQERGVKKIPWSFMSQHRSILSQAKLSDLDQECVALWRERIHLEADEWRKKQEQGLAGVHESVVGMDNDLVGQSVEKDD